MKKIKTSMKEIRNGWSKVFRAGYCDLQNIFRNREPQFYNSGVYGWNCDVYCDYKRDIAITTGYRNMAGIRIPDELIRAYDSRAKEILNKKNWFECIPNPSGFGCYKREITGAEKYAFIESALDENAEAFLDALLAEFIELNKEV